MSQNLPPLKPLKVFEVIARQKSFSRAAEELCITQSAVSHQIKQLEDFYGLPLLIREKKRTVLTQEGDMLLSVVTDTFHRLSAVTNHLLDRYTATIKIMAQTSIAADWLAPRLAEFSQYNPQIEFMLGMASHASDFSAQDYDIVIGTWPTPNGFVTRKIRQEKWFPVATPAFLKKHAISKPECFLSLPLFSSEKSEDWHLWMQQHQLRKPAKWRMQHFELAMLAVKAALSSRGIALSCGFMVEDLLKQKALVGFPQFSYDLPWGHYQIHYRSNSITKDAIEQFIKWVIELAN